MAEAKIPRVRAFLKQIAKAPLFQNVGEPLMAADVVVVADSDAAIAAFANRTWTNVLTRASNFSRAQQIVAFGDRWFQEQSRAESNAIAKEAKAVFKFVDQLWRQHRLPAKIGAMDPQAVVRSYFTRIAMDYAYEHKVKKLFAKTYLEPILIAGHLPCGWKGRLPPEGIQRSDVGPAVTQKLAAKSMAEAFGDGKLIVY